MCRACCLNSTAVGAAASPANPANSDRVDQRLHAARGLGGEPAADDAIRRHVGVARAGQRHGRVEELLRPGDHAGAPLCVVAAGRRQVAHRVRAVQRVVEAAPAGVRGIQGITRVHHRHDQLRARHAGDLGVDVRGLDREVRALGDEVAELRQERAVGHGVESAGRDGRGARHRLPPAARRASPATRGSSARRSWTSSDRPCQNVSEATPVAGSASRSIMSYSARATLRPNFSMRSVMAGTRKFFAAHHYGAGSGPRTAVKLQGPPAPRWAATGSKPAGTLSRLAARRARHRVRSAA